MKLPSLSGIDVTGVSPPVTVMVVPGIVLPVIVTILTATGGGGEISVTSGCTGFNMTVKTLVVKL